MSSRPYLVLFGFNICAEYHLVIMEHWHNVKGVLGVFHMSAILMTEGESRTRTKDIL